MRDETKIYKSIKVDKKFPKNYGYEIPDGLKLYKPKTYKNQTLHITKEITQKNPGGKYNKNTNQNTKHQPNREKNQKNTGKEYTRKKYIPAHKLELNTDQIYVLIDERNVFQKFIELEHIENGIQPKKIPKEKAIQKIKPKTKPKPIEYIKNKTTNEENKIKEVTKKEYRPQTKKIKDKINLLIAKLYLLYLLKKYSFGSLDKNKINLELSTKNDEYYFEMGKARHSKIKINFRRYENWKKTIKKGLAHASAYAAYGTPIKGPHFIEEAQKLNIDIDENIKNHKHEPKYFNICENCGSILSFSYKKPPQKTPICTVCREEKQNTINALPVEAHPHWSQTHID